MVALRTRRYYQALRWLIIMIFRLNPLRFSIIVGLVAVGRSLQGAAFAAVIYYFSAVESGTPVDFLGRSLDPRDWSVMAAVIAGVALALIIATFVIYVSATMGFRHSMRFADNVIKTVLSQEGAFPARTALSSDGTISQQAAQVSRAKVMLFRPVNVLLSLPRQLLLAIPSIAGMIWISGEVVAFLLILAAPAIALNYMISHRVIAMQKIFGERQKAYKKRMTEVRDIIADEALPDPKRAEYPTDLSESEEAANSAEAFATRLLAPRQSEFVSNVAAAVAIAAIGFYFGYEALSGAMPLAIIVGFFVLLRLTITSLTGISMSLTSYARFYGVVRAAYEYLTSPIANPKPFTGQPILHAHKQETPAPGSIEEGVKVERGRPVAVISPARLNRFTQYYYALALTQRARQSTRENLNAAALRCSAVLAEPEALAASGLAAMDANALKAVVEGKPWADLAPSIEDIRTAAAGGELSRKSFARIAYLSAILSSADLIIVHHRLIRILNERETLRWMEALQDRYIAVSYRLEKFSTLGAGEEHAIFLDYERAVAVVAAKDVSAAASFVLQHLKEADEPEDDAMDDL